MKNHAGHGISRQRLQLYRASYVVRLAVTATVS